MSLLDSHSVSGLCLEKTNYKGLNCRKPPHLFPFGATGLCRHLSICLPFVYVVIDCCKDLGHLICLQNLSVGELRGNGS